MLYIELIYMSDRGSVLYKTIHSQQNFGDVDLSAENIINFIKTIGYSISRNYNLIPENMKIDKSNGYYQARFNDEFEQPLILTIHTISEFIKI
jgi:hypothetical protein